MTLKIETSNTQMQNILVTGGAGYIGSHACKALLRRGFNPVAFDNLSTGWRDAVKFGPFFEGDLLHASDVTEAFEIYRPVAVMHFGALSQVGESVQVPELYWRNNLCGSVNLLSAAKEFGCDALVFSSTCATYGDQDGVVLNEDAAQFPSNAYGASKRAVEELLSQFGMAHGLRSVVFRYFNVAGADPEAEIGEFHRPETHLIPLILDAALGRRDALTIFGTDYPTQDGTCVRDYVHVSDLVDAHILGLEWLLQGKPSRVFNLGTGHGFTVREVIAAAERVTGRTVPIREGGRREGDCTKLVSGSVRAVEELGWKPERSNLDDMISDAWRWHQTDGYKS